MAKLNLLSMRVTEAENFREKRNAIAYDYIHFFEKLGFLIILVPNNSYSLQHYFELKDIGLFTLTGGNSVSSISDKYSRSIYDERNNTESVLIKKAIENNIPLLGICRGFHMINEYFNGELDDNIPYHVKTTHKLISEKKYLFNKQSNSYHNQGINKKSLAQELEPIAWCKDGYIEAAVHREHPILGIQWHPERQTEKYDKKLINDFLQNQLI